MNRIKSIDKNSLAEELELEAGDILLSINGQPIVDIIDYMFLINDEYIEIEIEKQNGEIWELEVDKSFDETLGIEFENPIIDHARSCTNNCVFCFIDQLPKGMRESLYFKDDDSRLSFLQGNFVTLTNLKDDDINRIIRYRISPINVSVHTTNPELRQKMLNNKFAGNILSRLKQLTDGGITVNAQIVLCPSYNDGEALKSTITDLMTLRPNLNSVAIVPIGLTAHREGLLPMRGFTVAEAASTIEIVHDLQRVALERIGTRFAFLADEFYILAGQAFPENEAYESYIQLEDGIGMIRKLETELDEAVPKYLKKQHKHFAQKVIIVTGTAAQPFLEEMLAKVTKSFPSVEVHVKSIVNHFFGEKITVAGLITGKDIQTQLESDVKISDFDRVLMPASMFRSDEEIMLDDTSIDDLNKRFGIPFIKVDCTGEALLQHLLYGGKHA
ncbi:DUF512 domain-containing protein [Fusibacter bizertensis]